MRILVLTHNYPRFPADPAGAFVRRIALSAACSGAEVCVLAPHGRGLETDGRDGPLRVLRFRYAPERFERIAYTGELHRRAEVSPLFALGVPLFLASFRRAARRAVAKFRPDVVHAHWWLPGGWVASTLERPYLITCHGSDVRLLERRWMRWFARPVFRRAAAVTTVSEFLARDLRQLLGEPLPRIVPLVMPVDIAQFSAGRITPPATPPRILYAGNLIASKGVDTLIRAFAALRDQGIVCQLKLLGEGSAARPLRLLAQQLGLVDIVWSTFVPQDQMASEYGAATVTVLPTLGQAEGLGLTLVEALLAGSAAIGTTAGGIPETIRDGETGVLVPAGDVPALTAALLRMLTEPDFRRRTMLAGRAAAEAKFSPERAVAPFLELYADLARDRT